MYNSTSTAYNTAINQHSRRFHARILQNGTELAANVISYALCRYSGNGEDYTLGQAFSSSVTLLCTTDADIKNQEILLQTGLYVGNTPEYVPDGYYTILTQKEKAEVKTVTGYDRMYVYGSQIYTASKFPITVAECAREIAQQLGTEFDTSCLTTTDANLQVPAMPQGYTLQVTAGYLAGLVGCNAYINRAGKLTFQAYADSGSTYGSDRLGDADVDSTARVINQIRCTVDDESTVLQTGTGDRYATMYNPLMSQAALNAAGKKIIGTTYYGAEIPMLLGDGRLDPWDIVTCNGRKILLHEMQISYDGDRKSVV